MDPSTISLSLALTLDVPRTWQEVVAVAKDAGEAMLERGRAFAPRDCRIGRRGTLDVMVVDAPRHDGTSACLTDLLATLLDGVEAPEAVQRLAYAPEVRRQTLGEGLAALTRLAADDRRADIAALAQRALLVRAEITAHTSRGAVESVGAFTLWRARARRQHRRQRLRGAAAAIRVLVNSEQA